MKQKMIRSSSFGFCVFFLIIMFFPPTQKVKNKKNKDCVECIPFSSLADSCLKKIPKEEIVYLKERGEEVFDDWPRGEKGKKIISDFFKKNYEGPMDQWFAFLGVYSSESTYPVFKKALFARVLKDPLIFWKEVKTQRDWWVSSIIGTNDKLKTPSEAVLFYRENIVGRRILGIQIRKDLGLTIKEISHLMVRVTKHFETKGLFEFQETKEGFLEFIPQGKKAGKVEVWLLPLDSIQVDLIRKEDEKSKLLQSWVVTAQHFVNRKLVSPGMTGINGGFMRMKAVYAKGSRW